jgi:predicted transcriptional regulator
VRWIRKLNFKLQVKNCHPLQIKIDAFQLNPIFSIHDFALKQNKSKRTCERQLKEMVKQGLVTRIKPGVFKTRKSA